MSKIQTLAALLASSATASMESVESTQQIEREVQFFIQLKPEQMEELIKAEGEFHEQWELRSPNGTGRIRTRKTIKSVTGGSLADMTGEADYVMTTKIVAENGMLETDQEVSSDIFNAFSVLAPSGMIKKRLKVYSAVRQQDQPMWELDLHFNAATGEIFPWARLEYEFKEGETEIPQLPPVALNAERVITGVRSEQTEEEGKLIVELFDTVFTVKREPKASQEAAEIFIKRGVGLEGLSEIFKGLKSLFARKSIEDPKFEKGYFRSNENIKAAEAMKKILSTQYLNSEWMKDKEFVKGDVEIGGIGKHLELNGNGKDLLQNVITASANYDKVTKEWGAILHSVSQRVQKIDNELETKGKNIKNDEEYVSLYKQGAKELADLRIKALKDFPAGDFSLLGNKKIVVKGDRVEAVPTKPSKGFDKVLALDSNGIRKASQLIIDILDGKIFSEDVFQGKGLVWLDHDDGSRLSDIDEDVYMSYYDNFYYQNVWYIFEDEIVFAVDHVEIIQALYKWITLSVKSKS